MSIAGIVAATVAVLLVLISPTEAVPAQTTPLYITSAREQQSAPFPDYSNHVARMESIPIIEEVSTIQTKTSQGHPCHGSASASVFRREVPLQRDASGYYFDRDADWTDDIFQEECTCDIPSAATSVTISHKENAPAETATTLSASTPGEDAPTPTEGTPRQTTLSIDELLDGVCFPGQRIGKREWPNGKIITPTNCQDWKKEYCNPMIPASVTLAAMVSEYRDHLRTSLPTSTA